FKGGRNRQQRRHSRCRSPWGKERERVYSKRKVPPMSGGDRKPSHGFHRSHQVSEDRDHFFVGAGGVLHGLDQIEKYHLSMFAHPHPPTAELGVVDPA